MLSEELERSKASVARLLKERDDLDDKLKQVGKELRQAINEKSVQVQLSCVGLPAKLTKLNLPSLIRSSLDNSMFPSLASTEQLQMTGPMQTSH